MRTTFAAMAAGTVLFVGAPAAAAGILTAAPAYAEDLAVDGGGLPSDSQGLSGDGGGLPSDSQGLGGDGQDPGQNGGGVATPELPSGALVAIGLVPLLACALLLRRRRGVTDALA